MGVVLQRGEWSPTFLSPLPSVPIMSVYAGVLTVGLLMFPIWVLWLNAETLLLLVQQEPCIARWVWLDVAHSGCLNFQWFSRLSAFYTQLQTIALPVSLNDTWICVCIISGHYRAYWLSRLNFHPQTHTHAHIHSLFSSMWSYNTTSMLRYHKPQQSLYIHVPPCLEYRVAIRGSGISYQLH